MAILRHIGLQFDDAKQSSLESLLMQRLRALNTSSTSYLWGLEHEAADNEIQVLAEQLTVNETYFFRNSEQFDVLARVVLPECLQARTPSSPLRILSAGCASGEEPYSIAIVTREAMAGATRDVLIRAVDLDSAALSKARRARFSAWSLRETSPEAQRRWFERDGRDFVLGEPIRAAVEFEQRNLATDDPGLWGFDSYDVVFCRNVIMYFSSAHAAAVIRRIARSLSPGGYLFLGHAETIRGLSDDFDLCNSHGTFYYKRKSALGASPRALPTDESYQSTRPGLAIPSPDEWVDVIRQASERVEGLADGLGSADARPHRGVAASWSVTRILELLRQEDFAQALARLEELPPEAGRDPDILLLQATLHVHRGDHRAADETCRKLLDLDDTNAGAHFVRGLSLEGAGDRDEAVVRYKAAIYRDPNFAMPHLRLGLIARATGDWFSARRELSQALALLKREDPARVLLFGGGFDRKALLALCGSALRESAEQS
jgi:chemotaxis protein methyltransferase CheR